jgi:non-ribosomal peptide synthase protein (TIGR01720 family)
LRLLGQERRDTAPIEDALLSAFVGALVQHAPAPTLQIAIEGHGRNDATGLDTSRLVGWLTRIDVLTVTPKERSPNAQDLRRAVQDARRQARELGRNETLPAIGFNYLGPTQLGAGAAFAPAPESMGSLRAPGAERLFALELVAALEDGALVITLHYGQDLHQEAIIRRLAQATIDGLVVLGSSDDAKAQGAPVDASLSGVSGRDLSRIMKKLRNRS